MDWSEHAGPALLVHDAHPMQPQSLRASEPQGLAGAAEPPSRRASDVDTDQAPGPLRGSWGAVETKQGPPPTFRLTAALVGSCTCSVGYLKG